MNTQKSDVMVTEKNDETKVKVVDVTGMELKQVKRFKYLGTEIAMEGGATEVVKQRIKMDEERPQGYCVTEKCQRS